MFDGYISSVRRTHSSMVKDCSTIVSTVVTPMVVTLASCWAFQPHVESFVLALVHDWPLYTSGVQGGEAVTWHTHQMNTHGCVCPWWCAWPGKVLWSRCMWGVCR